MLRLQPTETAGTRRETGAVGHSARGLHDGLRALGDTSAAEVLARAASQAAAAGSVMAAEAAPLVISMQIIRAALGDKASHSEVTRDTVAAELNLVRSAVGLLMLREYQFTLRALEAACGESASERKHADRAASFVLHAMADDGRIKKLAKRYKSDPNWPEDMYWRIWFALAAREAKRSDAPMATFALRVAESLVIMRERTKLAMRRGECTDAATSEMVRALVAERGEEAEWVLRAIARADECLADAAERAARRSPPGFGSADAAGSGTTAEGELEAASEALAAAAADVVPAGSGAVMPEAIALTAAGAAKRATEAAGRMLDLAVEEAPGTRAGSQPPARMLLGDAEVRAERAAVAEEAEEEERTEARAIDALVQELRSGSRRLVSAAEELADAGEGAPTTRAQASDADDHSATNSDVSLTAEDLVHLLSQSPRGASSYAVERWGERGRGLAPPSEDWGSPVPPADEAQSPVSMSAYRLPGDGVAVTREGSVPGIRGAHFFESAATRPLPGGRESSYALGVTYDSGADRTWGEDGARVTPVGTSGAGAGDDDGEGGLVHRVTM